MVVVPFVRIWGNVNLFMVEEPPKPVIPHKTD